MSVHRGGLWSFAGFALLAGGCSDGSVENTPGGTPSSDSPRGTFGRVAEAVRRADCLHVAFTMKGELENADGEVGSTGSFQGDLWIGRGNRVRFAYEWTPADGTPPPFLLVCDGANVRRQYARKVETDSAPPDLSDSFKRLLGDIGLSAASFFEDTDPNTLGPRNGAYRLSEFREEPVEGSLRVLSYAVTPLPRGKPFRVELAFDARTLIPKRRVLTRQGPPVEREREVYETWTSGAEIPAEKFLLVPRK